MHIEDHTIRVNKFTSLKRKGVYLLSNFSNIYKSLEYVGISNDIGRRLRNHEYYDPSKHTIDIIDCGGMSRLELEELERLIIQQERPKLNKQRPSPCVSL